MGKRFLALILCGMILLCLIACRENSAVSSDVEHQSKIDYESQVFITENITKITFYGYYGQGLQAKCQARIWRKL